MENIIANLVGSSRHETLNGRDYIVAPLTMIVPGVLKGSRGALFYPPDEIARSVDAWNGMPIVVEHPQGSQGQNLSARDPSILNKQGAGHVYKAKADGKLTAEAWLDVEKLRQISPGILVAVESGQEVEVSTGLRTENESTSGTENGVSYEAIARNYRPDHLAILSSQKGACSLDDGCGLNVNELDTENAATKSEGGRPFPPRDFAYVPDRNKPSTWKLRLTNVPGGSPDARIVGQAVAALGRGFRGNRVQIPTADLPMVKAKVRTAWLEANPGKTSDNLPRVLTQNKRRSVMDRTKTVDDLIENGCCWEEDDREFLDATTDEKLTAIHNQAKKEEELELVVNAATESYTDPQGNVHNWSENSWESEMKEPEKKSVENKDKKPQTAEEWLASAPPEIQEDLEFARNEKQKQKTALIDRLTANVADEDKATHKERLQERTVEDLQADVAMLPEPSKKTTANYSGASAGRVAQNAEKNLPNFDVPGQGGYLVNEMQSK